MLKLSFCCVTLLLAVSRFPDTSLAFEFSIKTIFTIRDDHFNRHCAIAVRIVTTKDIMGNN